MDVTDWRTIWSLYAEQGHVFRAVFTNLRRRGVHLPDDVAADLIHEFLLEKAPKALETFEPTRGALEGWLFVVFRRYVLGALRSQEERRRSLQLHVMKDEDELVSSTPSPEMHVDLQRVREAVNALPADQQAALRVYLASEQSSRREVAKSLGISRWAADRLVSEALDTIFTLLGHPSNAPSTRTIARALTSQEE
jgi:RNA polymerase sigma factor (sigma-70 family)